jgi:hypothetical protein
MENVRRFAVCASVILSVAACLTLVGAQEAPAPGPEHERLGYFVGNWASKGEIKENPMGMPAGDFTGKDHCEWFEGKFSVECRSEGNGPAGPVKGIGILGYSPMEGVYTYYGIDSTGMAMTTIPRGRVDGKTWVYDDEAKMGDTTVKNRYTMVETSATSYTFKWEVEGPDGWMTVMQGTSKKR